MPENELPDSLRAGDTVIYHLPRNYHNDEDDFQGGHRLGLVSRVYRRKRSDRIAVDLLVMLSQGDDNRNVSGTLTVHDAVFDADCPPGTFCEYTEDSDELPTVGDLRQVVAQGRQEREAAVEQTRKEQEASRRGGATEAEAGKPKKPNLPGETQTGKNEAQTPVSPGRDRSLQDTLPGDPEATIPPQPAPRTSVAPESDRNAKATPVKEVGAGTN